MSTLTVVSHSTLGPREIGVGVSRRLEVLMHAWASALGKTVYAVASEVLAVRTWIVWNMESQVYQERGHRIGYLPYRLLAVGIGAAFAREPVWQVVVRADRERESEVT